MKTKLIAALLLCTPVAMQSLQLHAQDSKNPPFVGENVKGYEINGPRYRVENRDGTESTGTITGNPNSGIRVVIPDDNRPMGIIIQGDRGYSRYYGD